ncbi:eIF2 kinase Gcn2p negative regulator [Pseudocyphellaria aurata]|nr:eIF2 kinase Gcn2p negative regulator [Pseudocyphellaria aurata]
MSDELTQEIEAINSIYGSETLKKSSDGNNLYILSLNNNDVTLRLSFPPEYPETAPQILGIETTGDRLRKGYGKHVLNTARETLKTIFAPGLVCVFDLMQELAVVLADEPTEAQEISNVPETQPPSRPLTPELVFEAPRWTVSNAITEKKSVFLARACAVTSSDQVPSCIAHLLSTDKRASKATHNISAYRIRSHSPNPNTDLVFQDCDDDGENAAGGRLLHLLQIMDVWGVLVVVSRWYGGVQLGPDRFRIINAVARDALITGGWLKGGKNTREA